jgi:hypothetical protein
MPQGVPDFSITGREPPSMGPMARGFAALGEAAERAVSTVAQCLKPPSQGLPETVERIDGRRGVGIRNSKLSPKLRRERVLAGRDQRISDPSPE